MNRHRLLRAIIRNIHRRLPQHRQARISKEPHDPIRRLPQHRPQQHDMGFLELGRRNRQDLMNTVPEDGIGKGVSAIRLPEVPQGEC